ncbi:hypothetical protein YPPY66_2959 [Yersinia pestis PY-66]|uniref:Uncharacterized protein n=2 Tax=Yersinia pseudotuberculosis complex TaxID=1649845 RepID=A0A0H3B2V5_YERPY|nr:hypothetical protein YPPY01_2649 [Yersinia pestis PY-01]EIQ89179.1 hypothetical protein YPPY02_2689 [Yersinia pestis PY-02]EIQ89888.1 hypothetical protein YPPY03_2748 [Yersinia pestis PY-03]EIR01449.1 hypothetical protein YPPY04_2715 [Yersinia pestis PY-04]EIR02958.1 hypothetical protein YPPY05_2686 [Yersinia pestis PY-05]EIR05989.1 hypothetical protein YPPY06_2744 [Yersinia pestis PY-06]EIR16983.1 hypothetical protein YPPY07_2612 [Yersinia pestis PY-07]EIR17807.1 hypothetical protein YPP
MFVNPHAVDTQKAALSVVAVEKVVYTIKDSDRKGIFGGQGK